jgi:hypothetical protein
MISFFIIFISSIITFIILNSNSKENWSNTFSGYPGPLEDGFGRYNIPALYGNPKYESKCKNIKNKENHNNPYYTLKEIGCTTCV